MGSGEYKHVYLCQNDHLPGIAKDEISYQYSCDLKPFLDLEDLQLVKLGHLFRGLTRHLGTWL